VGQSIPATTKATTRSFTALPLSIEVEVRRTDAQIRAMAPLVASMEHRVVASISVVTTDIAA
jgi:hypothetical protein